VADLDDITGWHEELRAQLETGSIGPAGAERRHIDFTTLQTLVRFFLRDSELRASVDSRKFVDARYPESFDPENPPDDIPSDLSTYYCFFSWFCWKTDDNLRMTASDIAVDVAYAFISNSTDHFDLELFPETAEFYELMKRDPEFV